MASYKNTPVTVQELNTWNSDKTINPRTKRKIQINGPIYTYLKNNLDKLNNSQNNLDNGIFTIIDQLDITKLTNDDFSLLRSLVGPVFDNVTSSYDDLDVITQNEIWIEKNDIKMPKIPSYLLLSYSDKNNKIRCFELCSVYQLYNKNYTKHPVTSDPFPDYFFTNCNKLINFLVQNKIIKMNNPEKLTINQKILSVFQKFSCLSIFMEESWFDKLDNQQLCKLCVEIKNVINASLDKQIRLQINKNDIFFSKSIHILNTMKREDLQDYVLNEIDLILSCPDNIKSLVYYTMIGAMSFVIKEIKDRYPDFCFD